MNIKTVLQSQYHAALAMLRQCVERCPAEVWTSGKHPRSYWRIVYHAVFFAHLYLVQNEEAFTPWEKHREDADALWGESNELLEPYTQEELLEYIDQVTAMVDATVEGLDLDTSDTGFNWYKSMGKLEHEFMSVRHIQGHVGQLSELLMAHGIDTDWIARRAK